VEFGLYVAADGKRAFISSDRDGGYGGMDIYSFELPSTAQPSSVVSLKGWVYNAQTEQAVKANIKVIEIESQKVYKTLSSDELNGSYLVVLPTGKNYAYHVNAEGYLPYSASFSLKDIKLSELVELKSPLTPIEKGAGFVLENIFFDSGDAQLKEESKAELDLLVNYLKDLPDMILEIGGHTDSDGSEESNVILSKDRAKAVYAYLVSRGVNESRLRYKGYGETQPLVPNDSESNKEKNRRTAFKVL
jgi:outer membrane protein OmpA-like peptidoglycan-associated protein